MENNIQAKIFSKQFFLENLLVLFFTYDFIVKIIVHITKISAFYNYVIVFKVLIVIMAIYKFGLTYKRKVFISSIVGLSIAYGITQITNLDVLGINDIQFNGYYFLSSVLPILFVFYCNDYDKDIIEKQVNRFLWFMAFSAAFVFIGYLLDIGVFRSYFRGGRFGYSGFLLYHHEAGYIYFIVINLLYLKFKRKKTIVNLILFLFIFISSFILGTKKSLFFTIIFLIYFVIDNIKRRKELLIGLGAVVVLSLLFFNTLSQIFDKYYVLLGKIYREDGFWSSFLSYRNVLFNERLYPYVTESPSFFNILFGWPLFNGHRSELEVFDLFLFFGLTGLLGYFWFFKNILKRLNIMSYFLVFSLIFGALFSGNLLVSVNVMIMIVIALKYFNIKTTK